MGLVPILSYVHRFLQISHVFSIESFGFWALLVAPVAPVNLSGLGLRVGPANFHQTRGRPWPGRCGGHLGWPGDQNHRTTGLERMDGSSMSDAFCIL